MFQWLLVILSLVILISNGTHSFNIINDTKTGLELHPPKTPTTNDEDFNATNSNYSNTNIINISARTTIKSDIKNCTQQQQHKQHKQNEGHEEEYHAEIRPCMFCNQSVSCDPDYLVCRENVCMLVDYEGSSTSMLPSLTAASNKQRRSKSSNSHHVTEDHLGRVIALILLTIFLLSLFTLCLRVCHTICGGGQGSEADGGVGGQRCCVIHCAISIQCCCDWKMSAMPRSWRRSQVEDVIDIDNVVPGGGGGGVVVGGGDTFDTPQRDSLYPAPPPAYIEIFPEVSRPLPPITTTSTASAAATTITTSSAAATAPIEVMEAINLEVSEPLPQQPASSTSGLPTSFQNGDQERSQDRDHGDHVHRRHESSSSPRRTNSWSASSNTNRVTTSTSEDAGNVVSISGTSPSSSTRNQRRNSSQPSLRQYSRLSRSSRGRGRT